ncbi:cadherin-like domain-containing protein [Methylobacter sp.]|uniref:cadherin-like domain-containing protein n=1 Tax=Methylobacter sp. TaxID=2051955 RepID=UPI00121AD2F1|nr:cadherin-like domain-containing protein [Methylobacter sp.]TAK59662.1 MAG: tandem-95 repeat protein [Methylobacter sp.]
MNLRLNKIMAAALVVFACSESAQALPGGCPIEGATPMNIGPVNPQNKFPLTVQDSSGLTMELCLDPALCISSPPIQGNLFSEQIGFGAEGFWASADTAIITGPNNNPVLDALLVTGVEAAFLTATPKDGDQFPFTRLRIRIDVRNPGIYTVTHPWGQEIYTVTSPGNRAINESFDISFAANSVHQGRIGPVLQWNPEVLPSPPAGYIGDPAVPHTVIGSPCETNFFRIQAVALDGVTALNIDPNDIDGIGGTSSVQTSLFNVSGKIYTQLEPTALVVNRSIYARQADSTGQVDIFVTSDLQSNVTVSGGSNLPAGENSLVDGGNGLYYTSLPLANAGILPKVVSVTANSPGKGPTKLLSLLTDAVNITRAEYNLESKDMIIEAVSSDLLNPPTLTTFGIGNLSNGKLTVPNMTVVPDKVRVTSSAGGSDIEHVAVVEGQPPQAVNDTYGILQNTALDIAAPGVLGNDSDPDGSSLTAVLGAPVNSGTLVLNPNGSFIYTPNTNFTGQDGFTYTALDGSGKSSALATVTLNVSAANNAPVAVDDSATTAEDTAVNIAVLAGDTDSDGDALTVASLTQPVNGTAAINGNTVNYTPNANYNGTDSFTYTVSDGKGGSDTATVTVTVTAVNDAPVAVNDTATTNAGTPVIISVRGNDSDVDGDILSITSVTAPANGSVVINNGQTVTYTPNAGFSGTNTFSYTIIDGNNLTATATVTVTVNPAAVIDQITVKKAEFKARDSRWTLNGTAGGNNIVTIRVGPNLNGAIVATVTANRGGNWSFNDRNSSVSPGANNSISIVSSGGGQLLNVSVTPK